MKRFISLLVALMICISSFAAVTVAVADEVKGFADTQDHWAQEDIEFMASRGIVNGVSATEFEPERSITRAEFLALVLRVIGESEATYDNAYKDVSKDLWYAGVVQAGKNLEIIDPAMTPNGEFNPDANITREEMTSFIIRAYESKKAQKAPEADISIFTDTDEISDWAKGYAESAYELSIVNGVDDKTFAPKDSATRAQAVTIVRRLYKTTGKSLKILSLGNSFSQDSMEYLYGMLEEEGYTDIVLGILYIGGCSLEKHYNYIANNSALYTYYKNTSDKWIAINKTSVETATKDQEWDIFVLQQSSGQSGLPDTYEPYMTDIIEYVKGISPNKDINFAWNLTWAYQKDTDLSTFPNTYNSDQMFMYNSIVNAFKEKVAPTDEFKYVFPVGTTIQNARTSYLGDTLTRDGYHLSYDIGRYMASLTWLGVLTDADISKVTYVPAGKNITEGQIEVAKESVINAMAKFDGVTQSEIIVEPEAVNK